MKFGALRVAAICGALGIIACATVPAKASPLLPAVWSGSVNAENVTVPFTGPAGATVINTNAGGSSTQAQVQGVATPLPSLTASAAITNFAVGAPTFADALGQLTYYIEIVGPTTSVFVPLSINMFGSLTSTSTPNQFSTSASQAEVMIDGTVILNVGSSAGAINYPPEIGDATGNFSSLRTLTEFANRSIRIDMLVRADVSGYSLQSASAFLDPLFFIDPSFANANQYSIILSDGIGNGTSATAETPLPAALPLFATGLAGLGWLARRRKQKQLAA